MKIVRENINFNREEEDMREILNVKDSNFQKIINILEDWDISKEDDWYSEAASHGYEDMNTYRNINFNVDDYISDRYKGTPLSVEVISDDDGEYYQFYFDASPIMSGQAMTLEPDHQSIDDFNINELIETLENYN